MTKLRFPVASPLQLQSPSCLRKRRTSNIEHPTSNLQPLTDQVRRSAWDVFFAWSAFLGLLRGQACRDESAGAGIVHRNRDAHSHSRLEIEPSCASRTVATGLPSSAEHTFELQSQIPLLCRFLLL